MKKYISVMTVLVAAFIMTGAGTNEKKVPMVEYETNGTYVENDEGWICGDICRDYIYLSEECEKDFPNLKEAFDEFNEETQEDYDDTIDDFTEVCLGYDEMMRESHEDEYYDYCQDTTTIHITRADENYVSFFVSRVAYWGGDETFEIYRCYNYDVETGELLEPADVILDDIAFDTAIREELMDKYEGYDFEIEPYYENENGDYELSVYDAEDPEYLSWCLTPIGINVYYDSDEIRISGVKSASVTLCFDDYPDMLNSDYAFEGDEYVSEFGGNEWFKADIDDDGETEMISFNPNSPDGTEDIEEYRGFVLSIDWDDYEELGDEYFYAYAPYYVHTAEGNYLYVHIAGYEDNFIKVIKFVDGEPVLFEKLSSDALMSEDSGSNSLIYKYRGPFFTNLSMVGGFPNFEELVCGTYIHEESDDEDEWESEEEADFSVYEIRSIDGRRYIEYSGPYAYAAAEIELMDEKPVEIDGMYFFMAKLYPFSSFSFAGDYWGGEPYVCYIRVHDDGRVDFSEGQPFADNGNLELNPTDEGPIHYILDSAEPNELAPEIVGSWRAETEVDGEEQEIYVEFNEDGTVYMVEKTEGLTPFVHEGIYNLFELDGMIYGDIYSEILGYGDNGEEATLVVNKETGTPIITEYTYDPSDVDLDEQIEYVKTISGEHSLDINPGPCDRREEINEMWDEYNDYEFTYDYLPEYIESLGEQAMDNSVAEECNIFCIEQNGDGGIVWMCLYDLESDGEDESPVVRDYVYYDFAKERFYYMTEGFQ